MDTNLTQLEAEVLAALRDNVEGENDGWGEVYLDNAVPHGKEGRAARGALGSLEQKGLYLPYDGDAAGIFGRVRLGGKY